MKTVRAKFLCTHVANNGSETSPSFAVYMGAVYSDDPNSENKKFTKATPNATFNMVITVPETAAFFEPGQEYYLDLTKAPKA